MSFKEYLLNNVNSDFVIIPWNYRQDITLEDVAYIAKSRQFYVFDDEFYKNVIINEIKYNMKCNADTLCLLINILYDMVNPKFYLDRDFLDQAWDIARAYSIENDRFGRAIKKFRFKLSISTLYEL